MKYKTKNEGISILIAMGGSFLVLMMAFATLLSVQKMLAQVESLERSTRLFFAAESGIEAAFYHHNAREAGVEFMSADTTQEITHLGSSITANWTIDGRTDLVGSQYPMIGLLKEDQTVQIPLHWDSSSDPGDDPNSSANEDKIGGAANEEFTLEFYKDSDDISNTGTPSERSLFEDLTGEQVSIDVGFDFGKDATDGEEILIDWSVSRTDSTEGIQTFNPTGVDCTATPDFICEDQLRVGTQTVASGGTARNGRVLPGYANTSVTLSDFMACIDAAAPGNCSEYTLTFRPLLKFESSDGATKIPGIPYIVRGDTASGSAPKSIPKQSYTVTATVSEGEFSQVISLEVPEKTSIGAFDYVIFD